MDKSRLFLRTERKSRIAGNRLLSWGIANRIVLIVLAICMIGLGIRLRNLNHPFINLWDEIFHAIVARNVAKHPLVPTFYDQPWLPITDNWTETPHIWLHKPPVSFWQIALSFRGLGVSPFSLRLPSALLSTLSIALTFLIGKRLFSPRVGMIAAGFQAVLPFDLLLVHGYLFADHVDVALLFWTELSLYLAIRGIQSGQTHYYAFAGMAEGVAYLSKSYLALINTGVLLVLWGTNRSRSTRCPISGKSVWVHIAALILTVLPWTAYCLIRFPHEFIYEQWHVFQHFNSNIGGWQGPWDKHLFGYLPQMFGLLYLPAMYSSIFMVYRSVQQSEWPVILTSSWLIIVVTTLSFATTKTPSATYVALPMFLVAMGYASDQAIYQRHSRHALAWGTCLLLSVTKILSDRPLIPALAEGLKPLAPTLSENPTFHRIKW